MGNKQPKKEEKVSDKLFDSIFEFRMQAKELAKQSKKSEKERDMMYAKVKKAIQDNKPEAAKLYAQDAIRKKNEAVKYELLSYKLEAVHTKLKSAYQSSKMNENMTSMVSNMSSALGAMDLVKISDTMSKFETIFDDLDANAQMMDKAMDNIDAGSYADRDVSDLIMQVAKVNQLELQNEFDEIKNTSDPAKVEKMIEKDKSLGQKA